MQQAQLQKQIDARVAAGQSLVRARLAVINPTAAEKIDAEDFGAEKVKFAQLKDGLGADHPAFINTSNQTINGQSIADYTKQNGANNSSGLGDMSLTGPEYLATVPPKPAGIIKAIAEGRQALPAGQALRSTYWQNILQATQQYDPSFDAANYSGRLAGVKDFSAGKSAESVRSLNQALAHVGSLIDSAGALHNGNYPALNYIGNKFNEATGAGEQGAFRTNANAVADEVAKFFKGAGISDHEIQEWKANLSENLSPAQQRAQIGKLAELLHGGIDALEEKRLTSIGPLAAAKQGPLVKPAGQAVLKRIEEFTNAGNSAPTVDRSAVEAELKRRGLLK